MNEETVISRRAQVAKLLEYKLRNTPRSQVYKIPNIEEILDIAISWNIPNVDLMGFFFGTRYKDWKTYIASWNMEMSDEGILFDEQDIEDEDIAIALSGIRVEFDFFIKRALNNELKNKSFDEKNELLDEYERLVRSDKWESVAWPLSLALFLAAFEDKKTLSKRKDIPKDIMRWIIEGELQEEELPRRLVEQILNNPNVDPSILRKFTLQSAKPGLLEVASVNPNFNRKCQEALLNRDLFLLWYPTSLDLIVKVIEMWQGSMNEAILKSYCHLSPAACAMASKELTLSNQLLLSESPFASVREALARNLFLDDFVKFQLAKKEDEVKRILCGQASLPDEALQELNENPFRGLILANDNLREKALETWKSVPREISPEM